jgi:hypothetical protein
MGDERAVQRVLGDRILGVTSRIVEAGQGNELLISDRIRVKAKCNDHVLHFNGEGLSCSSLVLGRSTLIKLNEGDYLSILSMTERSRVTVLFGSVINYTEDVTFRDERSMEGKLTIVLEGVAKGWPFAVASLSYLGQEKRMEWRVEDSQEMGPELLGSIDKMLTRVENGLAQIPQVREEK